MILLKTLKKKKKNKQAHLNKLAISANKALKAIKVMESLGYKWDEKVGQWYKEERHYVNVLLEEALSSIDSMTSEEFESECIKAGYKPSI